MAIIDDLQQSMLAESLGTPELQELAMIADIQTFYKNDIIFSENEQEDSMYVLAEGRVAIERRLLANHPLGHKHIQNVRRGQIFGEMGFIEKRSRSATAIAKSQIRVLRFGFEDLDELIDKDLRLGVKLLRTIAVLLSRRLRRMNDQWLRTLDDGSMLKEFEYF